MSERRKFTDYEKKTIYANGNGRCGICGKPINYSAKTVDHKIPLSKGGTNGFDNLQPACLTCNLLKGSLTMPELINQVNGILRHNTHLKIKYFFTKEAIR